MPTFPASAPRPEVLAFLATIKKRPEDDAPRLILADWLEEYGGPSEAARAEFIRLQCGAARTSAGKAREAELFRRFAAGWLGPLRPFLQSWGCWRGLFHLGAGAEALLGRFAPALQQDDFAWVESLTLFGADAGHAARLANSPWLTHLDSLEVAGQTSEGALALAASPHLSNLRSLFLRGGGIGSTGATLLARAPSLVNLTSLSLAHNRVGDVGAQALAAAPLLDRLTFLNVEGNPIGNRGLMALRTAAATRPRLWINPVSTAAH